MNWLTGRKEEDISLSATLSESSNADPSDVMNVKQGLFMIGSYSPDEKMSGIGLTPYPDKELFDGIENFQRKSGLTIGRVMQPGGETVSKLDETLKKANQVRENTDTGVMKGLTLGGEKFMHDFIDENDILHNYLGSGYNKREKDYYDSADSAGVPKWLSRGALNLVGASAKALRGYIDSKR